MSPTGNGSDSSKVIVLKKSTNMVKIALQKYSQNIHDCDSHSPWKTIPKEYIPVRYIVKASRICHIQITPKFNFIGLTNRSAVNI